MIITNMLYILFTKTTCHTYMTDMLDLYNSLNQLIIYY